jgi:hypothetical protein
MNKLKMLALTALAAATIGTGALATAPSASAMPATPVINCEDVAFKATLYSATAEALYAAGALVRAAYYAGLATAYYNIHTRYCV